MLCIALCLHDVFLENRKVHVLVQGWRHRGTLFRGDELWMEANRVMGALETSSRHEGKVLPSLFFDM